MAIKSFVTAYEAVEAETTETENYVEIRLDHHDEDGKLVEGRVLKIHEPTEGQATFMMAMMGRGQSNVERVSGMINLLVNAMDDSDAEYFSARLLTRDKRLRLSDATIEGIFDHLIEAWFGVPTREPSGSASTPPTTGKSSTPTTQDSRRDQQEVLGFYG